MKQKKERKKGTRQCPVNRGDSISTDYRNRRKAIERAEGCAGLGGFNFTRVSATIPVSITCNEDVS